MEELTAKQKKVLNFISQSLERRGKAPTYREIQGHFGYASTQAVAGHIDALVKKGHLKKEERGFRSLEPLKGFFGVDRSNLVALPQCMATVPMGNPKMVFDEVEDVHWISKSLTGPGEFFLFQAIGDSMIKAGILSGDYIIAKKQPTADVGDIVVAALDESVTLKRYGKDPRGNHLLIPENDALKPRIVQAEDESFRILGQMILLVRQAKNLKRFDELMKLFV
jgi:repressor LexA